MGDLHVNIKYVTRFLYFYDIYRPIHLCIIHFQSAVCTGFNELQSHVLDLPGQ